MFNHFLIGRTEDARMPLKNAIKAAQVLLTKIQMPILPESALALQNLFNESDMPDPLQVQKLISSDPFMAGELVGISNLLSRSNLSLQKVKDIEGAILRLGYIQIKNYVLSIVIKEMLSQHKIKSLSQHSQHIALITADIARYNKAIRIDEAYLLGLVHEIGSFALCEFDDAYGESFGSTLAEALTIEENEAALYGTNHSALGYVIAHTWNIPGYIAQAILLHHTLDITMIKSNQVRCSVALIELAHVLLNQKELQAKHPDTETYQMLPEAQAYLRTEQTCQKVLELSDVQLNDIRLNII